MAESPALSSDSINVSVTHLQASRYPLLRRFDQQFALETKFNDYGSEISRVNNLNKVALSSLGNQERRLKELQALLRSSSSTPIVEQSVRAADPTTRTRPHTKYNYQCHNANNITGKDGSRQCPPTKPRVSANVDSNPLSIRTAISHKSEPKKKSRKVTQVPDAPTNLFATGIKHDSFTLVWDKK